MDAEVVTRALGGRWHGGYGTARCPAHDDKRPSLSLANGAGGRLLAHCFAGCDFDAILGALRGLGLVEDDWRPGGHDLPRVPTRNESEAGRTEAALRLWGEARDPRGMRAETYLASRGLDMPDDVAGRVLRYHPACPFGEGARLPCLVAIFRDLWTDAPRAIHRTALSPEGVKLDRKVLGPYAGAAIKISADDDVELGLVVGEGIETCLAARALGFSPIWALGSAGMIGALPVLGGIEALTIMGETDDKGANAAAVRTCAARWTAAGADVEVLDPVEPGDANDVLMRRCSV